MQRLIVGSVAANMHITDWRQPKDTDIYAPENDFNYTYPVDRYWHASFEDWIPPGTNRIATLDELYTMKVSHSYWALPNGSWTKHISDTVKLKNAGATLDMSLHKLLYAVWESLHGKKIISLDQEAKDFFSDAVRRIYDHDSIHYSVAYGDKPLYEDFLDGTVYMDMQKVWAAPYETQIRLFREEVYATALERWVIPSNYKISPRLAYARALQKTITNLTKGRSARFLVLNYVNLRDPDFDYVKRHLDNKHKLIRLEENAASIR